MKDREKEAEGGFSDLIYKGSSKVVTWRQKYGTDIFELIMHKGNFCSRAPCAIDSCVQILSCATAAFANRSLCPWSMLGWKIKGPGIKSALFSDAAKGRRAVNIDWRIYGRWMPVLRSVEGKYDQSKANTTPLRQLRLAPSWAGGKRQKLKAPGILCDTRCIINVLKHVSQLKDQ